MKYRARERRAAAEYEAAIAEWWQRNHTFEQSIANRPEAKSYVFYDGPPFITGLPHHGTLLSSIVKDAVPRYWAMQGYHCERRWGWDCHGLPAENFVEKQLGILDRRDIGTKWSLEDYIIKARDSMIANSQTWQAVINRVGRWVDFTHPYRTMDKSYMESVWWAFKQLYNAGKIYEGRKVLMYDTKFATPVSKAEVTMDNDAYQTVTDPSVYVKFKLVDEGLGESSKVAFEGVRRLRPRIKGASPVTTGASDPSRESTFESSRNDRPLGRGRAPLDGPAGRGPRIDGACPGEYFLAWTTTPWTLLANRALAVSKDLEYVKVKVENEIFILAKSRLEAVFKDEPYEILSTTKITGADLASTKYTSIDGTICQVFTADFVTAEDGTGIVHIAPAYGEDDYELYKQHSSDDQSVAGGVVRINSASGWPSLGAPRGASATREKMRGQDPPAEDAAAGPVASSIGFIDVLDANGYYLPEHAEKLHALGVRDTDAYGIQIWAANKFIAKCLEAARIVYKIEYIQHEYPFNPRSKERIMYRAFPSWFFDIQGSKPLMLEQNEHIHWFPDYLKHGRFAKNIEAAPDWNLSRDRFWATAMPVWKSAEGTVLVIGSYQELKDYSGVTLSDYHRPWVDEVEFDAWVDDTGRVTPCQDPQRVTRSEEGPRGVFSDAGEESAAGPVARVEHFKRIDKVLDCWFESGSMPFAELHYPFENKEKFERSYPADFIVEYVGQVRAWFYYLHAVNTSLAAIGAFGEKAQNSPHKNAFKHVITTGTLAGNDGRKMSKSLGNYTDPTELMNKYSADAYRFLLLSSPVMSGEDFAMLDKDVSDVHRKLSMLWNVYDFFTTYAEIEGWDSSDMCLEKPNLASPTSFETGASDPSPEISISNPLDLWIFSRLSQLNQDIIAGMEEYNLPRALAGVPPFIDDLSNWYVRRSRRRFSKNSDAADKQAAFATLYTVLVTTAQLLAPFTPFLSEELYQKMTGSSTSVHLLDYPKSTAINPAVLGSMSRTRQIITDALALRMQKSETEQQIKVRQPLSKLTYDGEKLDDFYENIIAEEVNVKQVKHGDKLHLDKTLTESLRREGYARDLIRIVQAARKHAGLRPDDHIRLSLSAEIPAEFRPLFLSEVLASELHTSANYAHDEIATLGSENITISLEKI